MGLNLLISLVGIGIAAIIAIGFYLLLEKTKPKKKLRKYLTLTGASLAGFFLFVILHNLISGISSQLLNREIEEPVFFILATLVCPIGLVIGLIASAIELLKQGH